MIVGAGLFGATVAECLARAGRKVLVVEARNHTGGNCFSEIDSETGIECHRYGSHIFHTSYKAVWDYVNRFAEFNNYRHTVRTTWKERTYSLPINLGTINAFYGLNLKPSEARAFIQQEADKEGIETPRNLEEQAITLVGRPLYEAFIKGYTVKQWGEDPQALASDIIARLPVRYSFNNRYFDDEFEGIPLHGYSRLFERMLDSPNIEVRLGVDYFELPDSLRNRPTVYTGPIDRFFQYKCGKLDWRTIDLERQVHDVADYQGCAVMNYADTEVPYTRIHEFKHYHPERPATTNTVVFKEFSRAAEGADEPYYPVPTARNAALLERYQQHARRLDNIWFGGRLGQYRYLDMDDAIDVALQLSERLLGHHAQSRTP